MSAFSHLVGFTSEDNKFPAKKLPFANNDSRLQIPQDQADIKYTVNDTTSTALPNSLDPSSIHSRLVTQPFFYDFFQCPPAFKKEEEAMNNMKANFEKSDVLRKSVEEAKKRFNISEDAVKSLGLYDTCYAIGDYINMRMNNVPGTEDIIKRDDPLFKYLLKCYYLGVMKRYLVKEVRLIGTTPVLNQIVDWFSRKSKGLSDSKAYPLPLKLAYFSAHDSTINNMLLQIKNGTNSTCLIEELETNKTVEGCNPGPRTAS